MAAVCYTCYRPARTGYVRQSIALILALAAALCVSVVVEVVEVRAAVQTVYRLHPLAAAPLSTLVARARARADPLHLSSQELHHQVITSTSSCVPSMVLLASHPDAFTVRARSFPKPLRPVTARHRALGVLERAVRLMLGHEAPGTWTHQVVRYFVRFLARRYRRAVRSASSPEQ